MTQVKDTLNTTTKRAGDTAKGAGDTARDAGGTAKGLGGAAKGVLGQLPVDRLRSEAQDFGQALSKKGMSTLSGKVDSLTGRLNDYATGNTSAKTAMNVAKGDSPVKAGAKAMAAKVKDTVKEKFGGGKSGSGTKIKVTNIVESVDIPVPRNVAYEQWTLFEDFPTFMKKVENVKQEEDEVVTWKAQVFWSHRTWKATIVDQVPNERIVWKSEGEKGHVDGAVTFHELAPDLTRVLVNLEYHPKGLFEHTGNIWRAQGRRARLELKHFRRFVANNTLINQEEVDGWKGEIHDEHVTDSGEGEGDGEDQQRTRQRGEKDESSERQDAGGSSRAAKSSPKRPASKKSAPAKKTAAKKSTAKKTTSKKASASRTRSTSRSRS